MLMNVVDKSGRAWQSSVEVTHQDSLEILLEQGYRAWINDSYWMFMPYKLKDSGVTLKHKGVGTTTNGAAADILTLTFDGVGVTPQNKYDVYVARSSKLVVQWDFFANAADAEPRFQMPWADLATPWPHLAVCGPRRERPFRDSSLRRPSTHGFLPIPDRWR